jgi:hypothetical protein
MNKSTNTMAKVLLLLLLAVAGSAKAQGYQSYFAADSTRLNVYMGMIDFCHTFYLTVRSADTVNINGTQYVQGFPHGKYGYIYEYEDFYFTEDTATGRLYRYSPVLDDKVLICDMSLSVGDNFYYTDEYGDSYAKVYNMTYEDGKKVIYLTDCYNSWVFQEGCFPSYLPIGILKDYSEMCSSYLLCEYKDGEQIFVNQKFEICYIDDVSVREQIQQQMEVSLYPNPAKEKVMIKGIKPAEVQFYNVLGQMVKTVKNSNEINVAGLPEGIYLLHITNTEGKVYTNKITIQ